MEFPTVSGRSKKNHNGLVFGSLNKRMASLCFSVIEIFNTTAIS